ncbi:MAG: HAMP domain-containing protein [FCB group bacterium]|nr:HAMP domain-containing protein [FCB group bacterium]
MTKFHDFSIRAKISIAIVLTSIITLVLSSLVFIINDKKSFQQGLINNLSMMSQIMADNCSSAVNFDDNDAAQEVLQTMKLNKNIIWAVITLPDGSQFARFNRSSENNDILLPQKSKDDILLNKHDITVRKTIKANGRNIGSLWVRSDLNEIDKRQQWFLGITLIVLIAATLVSILVAFFFQRLFSKPIKELEKGAKLLSRGNLEANITYTSKDEIGSLADSLRQLINYIRELSIIAESLAENDLTIEFEPKSEKDVLGNSFKKMLDNITGVVRQLTNSTNMVVSAANEIASTSIQINKGSQQQTDQINQVTTAIEQMAATIIENTKNAKEVTDAAQNASETASTGGQIVSETVHGMQRIYEVVYQSSQSIGQLANSAQEIGDIISVINDIADQTNLLALNAAIEAARAGEHGRGFAVVADEVRKLAERTGKATKEITEMIKGIQDKTSQAVNEMKTGIKEVETGSEYATQAGGSLNEIVEMTGKVMDMIKQIAHASEEQSIAAGEISNNMEHISTVTKENSQGAEQASTAAQQLNQQAEELKKIVESFKIEG